MNADWAAQASALIAATGLSVGAVERWSLMGTMNNLLPWEYIKTNYSPHSERSVVDAAFGSAVFVPLTATVQAAAGWGAAIADSPWTVFACALALVTHMILHYRVVFGFDGSDQMQGVIWGGLLVFHSSPVGTTRDLALGFIVGQLLLSYVAAGVAKLMSPIWRSGAAVELVLGTATYGSPMARALASRRGVSAIASWATMVFEAGCPLFLLLGYSGAVLLCVGGAFFHLSVATLMGLNLFVWAFLACYPPLIYLAGHYL